MHSALLVSETNRDTLGALAGASPDLIVIEAGDLAAEALRAVAAQARANAPRVPVFIRIGPLAGMGLNQLAAALPAVPDGIWLGETVGRAQVEQVASRLAVAEAELGIAHGAMRVVASIESAAGVLAVASLAGIGRRLAAIASDLASVAGDIGCEPGHGPGRPEPLRSACGNVVLAAAAARVPAIDCTAAYLPDPDAFAAQATQASRDGYSAVLARDIRQVEVLRRLSDQALVGRWMENFVSGVATK